MATWLTGADVAVSAAGYLCALVPAGGAAFVSLATRPGVSTRPVRRLLAATALAGAALAAIDLALRAAFLGGDKLAAVLDPALLALVADSPAGTSAALRAAGLAACLALLAERRFADGVAWLGGALVVASFAAAGHVLAEPRWALAALIVVHTAAVAYWLAALPGLWLITRHTPLALAAGVVADFGRRAPWAVAALVAAGAGLLILLAGSAGALVRSDWGLAIGAKLLAVAALIGAAAYNKLRLTPALTRGDTAAARALRMSIAAEIALAALILLATTFVTGTTPPGH